MRRKGTPCACECNPCKGKNYVRAVNNVSPDPNGDLELKAGNGIAISQSGDNQITITNDAIASSFVAGDNIEINPSGDNLEIRVTDDVSINNLNVAGDIIQQGAAYETHAEKVYTTNDYIYMRDGAVGGLAVGDFSGFQVIKYDGTNDGRLVIDNSGVARVGDVGDEQPLLTRDESGSLPNGVLLQWNGTSQKAVSSGVNTSQIVRGSGNIGSDTKPVKVVNGVATEVTNDLQKKMGTVTAANGINLATNTPNFDVVSVTAPISGRAVVNIRGGFANNGAGYRLVGYAKNTTSAQTEWLLNTNSNGDYLYYSVPLIIDVNAGDVIHGCAYQTSGSTLNVSMGITMMIYPM